MSAPIEAFEISSSGASAVTVISSSMAPTSRYPVQLRTDDNDTILATFPDFPEGHPFGDDCDEALTRSVDALTTVIEAYIRDHRDIPLPSKRRGPSVELEPLLVAKVELYRAMREQQIGKAELGRRLGWHLPQVDRLLDG